MKSNITIAPKSRTFNFVTNNKQSKRYSNTIMVRWLTNDFIYLFIWFFGSTFKLEYTFSNGLKMFSKIYGSPWPLGLRAISHQFVGYPILKSTFVGSFWLDFGSSYEHNHGIVSRFLRPTWQNNIGPIKSSIS